MRDADDSVSHNIFEWMDSLSRSSVVIACLEGTTCLLVFSNGKDFERFHCRGDTMVYVYMGRCVCLL